jgi:glutamine synthetase
MWVARYLLGRIAELFKVKISLHPKLVKGDWNGSGCHTNFSGKSMREEGGYEKII